MIELRDLIKGKLTVREKHMQRIPQTTEHIAVGDCALLWVGELCPESSHGSVIIDQIL